MPTLDWLTRRNDEQTAGRVPYRLLEPIAELSAGDPAAENMLIHGDNLAALKALLPFYAGRIKCIYIDPPYNTRSAFAHYDDNLEHSQWLVMIYPRLELLRDLLAEDGSIWVSIDDNEGHYLKVVMDEVFGRGNFLQTVIWFRKVSPANDAKWFSNDHDYVHVYAKNLGSLQLKRLERQERHNIGYKNPDSDPRGLWNSVTLTGNKTRQERPNLYYSIKNPLTDEDIWPPQGLTWRLAEETYQEVAKEDLIYWGKDGKSRNPRIKRFLETAKPVIPRSVWLYDEVGHTQESMLDSKTLFQQPFGTPKTERLLGRILAIATNPGDLVLDSFLGSGTTAAVAHKMGRRYIGIELGEHAVTHPVPRLRKVIEGEQGGISGAVGWQGGGGFRFYRLGEPVFDEQGRINPAIRFPHLAAHVWFAETRTPYLNLTAENAESAGELMASASSAPSAAKSTTRGASPLLGIHHGVAYYLLYNGILGDRRPAGGNVLTRSVLAELPPFAGPKVIYGESCRLSAETLAAARVTFKQIPYDLKAR